MKLAKPLSRMNPLAQLLKLSADAKVGDAKKLVSEQVLASMSSYPGREALLSALECGAYDKKLGKRRGKTLTLLDEELSLEEHHAIILREANKELRNAFHELVQDDLETKDRYRLEGERPVLVNYDTADSMPSAYQLDLAHHFKTSEAALKKHARELNQSQGFLTREQLNAAQLALLASPAAETAEDNDQDDDDEDEEGKE